jgi:hypothetical protein
LFLFCLSSNAAALILATWMTAIPPEAVMQTCPKCNAPLVLKPVPGALKFPQRLECPGHGRLPERITPIRMRFHKDRPHG